MGRHSQPEHPWDSQLSDQMTAKYIHLQPSPVITTSVYAIPLVTSKESRKMREAGHVARMADNIRVRGFGGKM